MPNVDHDGIYRNRRANTFLTRELAKCTTEVERQAVREAMDLNIVDGRKLKEEAQKRKEKGKGGTPKKVSKKEGTRKWRKYNDEIRAEAIRVLSAPNAPSQYELAKLINIPQRRLSDWWVEAVKKGEVKEKPRRMGSKKKKERNVEKETFDKDVLEGVEETVPKKEYIVLTEEELLLLWCNLETSLKPEFIQAADNIMTGKVLKRLYEKHGGDQAAFHAAKEKGWC